MTAQVRKTVVAFMLLWAFADLSVPGFCQDDDDKIKSEDSWIGVASDGIHSPGLSAAGAPAPEPGGPADECFCCSRCASPKPVFDHHASVNPGAAPASAIAAEAGALPLAMATQQLTIPERRRSHSTPPDIFASPLRC